MKGWLYQALGSNEAPALHSPASVKVTKERVASA